MGSVTSSRATLTVASVTPAPTEARGGGGGGAMSLWFLLALAILCFTRRSFRCAIAAGRLPGGGSIRSDR
jgi:hypothetical protein